jgi:hypothetical protein
MKELFILNGRQADTDNYVQRYSGLYDGTTATVWYDTSGDSAAKNKLFLQYFFENSSYTQAQYDALFGGIRKNVETALYSKYSKEILGPVSTYDVTLVSPETAKVEVIVPDLKIDLPYTYDYTADEAGLPQALISSAYDNLYHDYAAGTCTFYGTPNLTYSCFDMTGYGSFYDIKSELVTLADNS